MARLKVKRWAGTEQETELDIIVPPTEVHIHKQLHVESAGSVYTRHYPQGDFDLAMPLQEAVDELNAALNWEYPGHRSEYMQLSKDHDGHVSVSCGSCGQNIDRD
jgi:hypothetical protein